MKFLFFLFSLFVTVLSFSQGNIDSLSHVNYQTLHGANLNDLWGYVDEFGNEYAIVGTTKGTSIVDVTNPSNPVEVFWLAGSQSIWRDPCVHGDYAYVTTEAHDGLLIIDLSPLPASTILPTTLYTGPITSPWQSAHTCFVDDNGYAYIFGSNRGNGGAIILDVHTDPMNPIEVGVFDDWYVHDGFVRNDTMYLAHISDGFFSLVNCADKANPILLGTQITPNNFTHNIWPTDNGNYVFTTDEVSGAYIAAYDITDPLNMIEVDRIQNSPGQGVIPHNTHVLGNYLVTSYYSDGIVIHDITYPYNIVKVGSYDTYPGQTTGFDGDWGVYPFLPSGNIIASDITQGLFILGPTYHKASYLEGLITDASTLNPIFNVSVQITGNEAADHSNGSGMYASGILGVGAFTVNYSKVGYYPQTLTVNLAQGVISVQNVQLVPIPPFNLTVNVVEAGTLSPIPNAQILLSVPILEHTGLTNGIGQENMVLYYQQQYNVSVGKWGYFTNCFEQFIDQSTGTLTVQLEKGYQDEFSFDFGWLVNGMATSGVWERGKPNGSNSGSAPSMDADFDCSEYAYVTGNDAVLNPDLDDVDGGVTQLISPTMDLSTYSDPYLNFSKWFYCYYGNPPDDTLRVSISNGITAVTVAEFGSDIAQFYQWIPVSIRILDHIALTNSMHVTFHVSDYDPNVNITEAGIDYFYISNSNVLQVDQKTIENNVYPNPFSDELVVTNALNGDVFMLCNPQGKCVLRGVVENESVVINTHSVPSGVYFLIMNQHVFKVMKD